MDSKLIAVKRTTLEEGVKEFNSLLRDMKRAGWDIQGNPTILATHEVTADPDIIVKGYSMVRVWVISQMFQHK